MVKEEKGLMEYFADQSELITLDLITKDTVSKYESILQKRISDDKYQNWGKDQNGNTVTLNYSEKRDPV